MFRDQPIDDSVQSSLGAAELHDARNRKMKYGFHTRKGNEEVVEVHDRVDLVIDSPNVVCDLSIEKCARDNLERKRHHRSGDIDRLVGLPLACVQTCTRYNLARIGSDALPVEGWSDDSTLADMNGVV